MKKIRNRKNLNMVDIINNNNYKYKKFFKDNFSKIIKSSAKCCFGCALIGFILTAYIFIILTLATISTLSSIIGCALISFIIGCISTTAISIFELFIRNPIVSLKKKNDNMPKVDELIETLENNNIIINKNNIESAHIEKAEDVSLTDNLKNTSKRRVTNVIKLSKKDKLYLIKQITTITSKGNKNDLYVLSKDDIKELDIDLIKKLAYNGEYR